MFEVEGSAGQNDDNDDDDHLQNDAKIKEIRPVS
jgi:hypothetical protein